MIVKLKKASLVFRKGFKGFHEKNVNNMKKNKKQNKNKDRIKWICL